MIVYLMGYMGSGKTTVGKKLARAMNYDFVDLDRQIEEQWGDSIASIFEQKGEEEFRKMEKDTLYKTFELEDCIVSLGGGSPCYFDNMEQINRFGRSVYLKLSAASLSSRLQNAKTPRPLIQGLSEGELFEFVQQQLGEREQFYNKAHLIVKGESLNIKELVNLIQTMD